MVNGLDAVNIVADVDGTMPEPLIAGTVRFLYDLREHLPMFVVYDHPQDFPEHYVAALWLTTPHTRVRYVLRSSTLDRLRHVLEVFGLVHLHRNDGDDPVILETWL